PAQDATADPRRDRSLQRARLAWLRRWQPAIPSFRVLPVAALLDRKTPTLARVWLLRGILLGDPEAACPGNPVTPAVQSAGAVDAPVDHDRDAKFFNGLTALEDEEATILALFHAHIVEAHTVLAVLRFGDGRDRLLHLRFDGFHDGRHIGVL